MSWRLPEGATGQGWRDDDAACAPARVERAIYEVAGDGEVARPAEHRRPRRASGEYAAVGLHHDVEDLGNDFGAGHVGLDHAGRSERVVWPAVREQAHEQPLAVIAAEEREPAREDRTVGLHGEGEARVAPEPHRLDDDPSGAKGRIERPADIVARDVEVVTEARTGLADDEDSAIGLERHVACGR